MASGGISLRFWRLYAQAWLICLLFPILVLIELRPPLPRLLLAGAGLAVFVASYSRIMCPTRSAPRHGLTGLVPASLDGLQGIVRVDAGRLLIG